MTQLNNHVNGKRHSSRRRAGDTPDTVVGLLEWFCVGEVERVEQMLADMRELGVTHLRTGISWADWHTPQGEAWYNWLLPRLAAEIDVLPCVVYTPPSLGMAPRTSAPPADAKDFADFIDHLIQTLGHTFTEIEFWNEPNNLSEWDWTLDEGWQRFAEMVGNAAYWAKQCGKRTVLGGMSPIDPGWLRLMFQHNAMNDIDVVGVHGFPNVWEANWEGWDVEIGRVQAVLDSYRSKAQVWITEVGFSTHQHDELAQLRQVLDAREAPVERVYWYAWQDLAPNRSALDGFHLDEREYHFGLKRADGTPKLLYRMWASEGLDGAADIAALQEQASPAPTALAVPTVKLQDYVLVVGGAGFIGSNLSHRLMQEGKRVLVFDALARPGVERNLRWLHEQHPGQLLVQIGDVRNPFAVGDAIRHAAGVYHLGAQVAVTTSMENPAQDFSINAQGTFILLEALRKRGRQIPFLFTSTNKVYGDLQDVPLQQDKLCYYPADDALRSAGIGEARPLAFHSPYGCSKGAADQYVLDYAETYDLPTTVFRMSCIYGPRQFGTEDQGWVAHFLIRALQKQPITLFGDGKQVRDILFVDDLVRALRLAHTKIDQTAGEAFNVGGGPARAVSLLELLAVIEQLLGHPVQYSFDDWRRGDQKYYVSDTSKLTQRTGWQPQVGVQEGLERLHGWLLTLYPQPQSDVVAPTVAHRIDANHHSTPQPKEGEHIYGG